MMIQSQRKRGTTGGDSRASTIWIARCQTVMQWLARRPMTATITFGVIILWLLSVSQDNRDIQNDLHNVKTSKKDTATTIYEKKKNDGVDANDDVVDDDDDYDDDFDDNVDDDNMDSPMPTVLDQTKTSTAPPSLSATMDSTEAGTSAGTRGGTLGGTWEGTGTGTWEGTGDSTATATATPMPTAMPTTDGTMGGTLGSTWEGSLEGTMTGSEGATSESSLEGTVAGTSGGTVGGTSGGTLGETEEGTAEGTVGETVEGTAEGTIEGTIAGTVEGTLEGTLEGTAEGTAEDTAEGTEGSSMADLTVDEDSTHAPTLAPTPAPPLTIMLTVTGDLGNNLGKLGTAVALREWMLDSLEFDVSNSVIALRHHSSMKTKWTQGRSVLQKCFPVTRTMDFEFGNTEEYDERERQQRESMVEWPFADSSPDSIIHEHADTISIEAILERVNRDYVEAEDIEETLQWLIDHRERLNQQDTHGLVEAVEHNISFPYLTVSHYAARDPYVDRYYEDIKNYLDMDRDSCCGDQRPTSDEHVLFLQNTKADMPKKYLQKGMEEIPPQHLVDDIWGHLPPGSKVAIVSPTPKEADMDPYISALEDKGHIVRVIRGQGEAENLCFLWSAEQELVGVAHSTYFYWAALFGKAKVVHAYSIDSSYRTEAALKFGFPVHDRYEYKESVFLQEKFNFPLIAVDDSEYTEDESTDTASSTAIAAAMDAHDPSLGPLTLLVQLTGDFGGHIGKLGIGLAIQEQLRSEYGFTDDNAMDFIVRQQDTWQAVYMRQDIQMCFPQTATLNLTRGNTEVALLRRDQQEEYKLPLPDGLKEYFPSEAAEDELVSLADLLGGINQLEHQPNWNKATLDWLIANRVDLHMDEPLLSLGSEANGTDTDNDTGDEADDDDDDDAVSFPFLNVNPNFQPGFDMYTDKYFSLIRDFFTIDADACCQLKAGLKETVIRFQDYEFKMGRNYKYKGYEELSPQHMAQHLSFLKKGAKIAISTPYPNQPEVEEYAKVLEEYGGKGWSVRIIGENHNLTKAEDFCFMRSARKRIIGPAKSVSFFWAAVLGNVESITAYSVDSPDMEASHIRLNKPLHITYDWTHPDLKGRIKTPLIKVN